MSELLSPPADGAGLPLTQTQKDLIGGSVGGITQVLVGQVCCPLLTQVYGLIPFSPFHSHLTSSRSECRQLHLEHILPH